jgi:lipopolysaccharide export system protein LptC
MNWYRNLWERFLLYLPLAVMAFLALATYWLVRSTPAVDTPQGPRVEVHDPDYFMDVFTVRTFDAKGRIRTEVQGKQARHYPDNKWMEIDQILVRSFDEKGRLTTASARQGLTNEDQSEVQLMGDAVVVREADATKKPEPAPRMEYRSEFLHAFLNTEIIKSHKPVELTRGKDRFTADTLEFDNVEQVMDLRGRVRGVLVPTFKE